MKILERFRNKNAPYKMRCDFKADGLGTKGKSLKFMESGRFKDAWGFTSEVAKIGWEDGVPDIRWRAHVAIWAAQNGLRIEGDFVECGVHTGTLSLAVCKFLNFDAAKDRKFWLFDTWSGIPMVDLSASEKAMAEKYNSTIYKSKDVYDTVGQAFSQFPNCRLIKGVLPGSLQEADIKKNRLPVH